MDRQLNNDIKNTVHQHYVKTRKITFVLCFLCLYGLLFNNVFFNPPKKTLKALQTSPPLDQVKVKRWYLFKFWCN